MRDARKMSGAVGAVWGYRLLCLMEDPAGGGALVYSARPSARRSFITVSGARAAYTYTERDIKTTFRDLE
jgi:hypothetical protein